MAETTDGRFILIDGPIGGVDEAGDTFLVKLQRFQQAVANASPLILEDDETSVGSNTLTSQNGLSKTVAGDRSYWFKIVLFIAATAGEGMQFDLNGGSAGMTWMKAMALGYDGSSLALVSPVITSLSTVFGPQDAWSGKIEIEGSFVLSGDGTFIPRIAQTAHGSGSVQVLKGSSISVS